MWKDVARLCLLLSFANAVAAAAPDDKPPPIRSFDIPTLERLGQQMYAQDQEAWKATDLLFAKHTQAELAQQHQHGWIVVTTDGHDVVRFINDGANGPEASYDVTFAPNAAPVLSEAPSRALTPAEISQYKARQLALRNVTKPCSDRYNTIALKDPEGTGWLVWAIAATTDPNVVLMGGHYRFTISPDGNNLIRQDAMSLTCRKFSLRDLPADAKFPAYNMNQIVAPTPVEIHVFENMTSKVMLYVFTYDDTTWKVADGRITTVPQDAPGMDGASARIASGQAEQCRMVLAMQVGGSEKYTVGPETKVILPTEHDDKYVPPNLPKDARPVAIACTRFGIVPAPNDYKLATAGLHLMIKDIGDGHTLRLAQLDRDTGKFEFKLLQGDPLPADLAARVDARLRAFDKATQTGQ